jgi:hypothetical protein
MTEEVVVRFGVNHVDQELTIVKMGSIPDIIVRFGVNHTHLEQIKYA